MAVRTTAPPRPATHEAHGSVVTDDAEPTTHHLVDFDRYVVSQDGPVGYVEVVAHVFVCYLGHPYAKAEEIAQVLDFERAVQIVAGRARAARRHKLAT
ncbi:MULTISPECIES: hypothetical protein [unclassified Microbacterium]|uniref:hypothetical protein n=1 Tax=unclassified Microbacterium TaxID=2609290 RepID=UPI000EAA1FAE|nr:MULTISPECIES: hypothetical protein [unclassified Microbacterium]MBT2484029.1 hypothetical protein [Microbacterium sp. ISL-108]RKN66986.1 hypothetical protein D7252_04885 [Microbacterium sp. CGR2]